MNRRTYLRIAAVLAATILVLGFAILIRTATGDGGSAGWVIGALFVGLGAGRLYLLRKNG